MHFKFAFGEKVNSNIIVPLSLDSIPWAMRGVVTTEEGVGTAQVFQSLCKGCHHRPTMDMHDS